MHNPQLPLVVRQVVQQHQVHLEPMMVVLPEVQEEDVVLHLALQ